MSKPKIIILTDKKGFFGQTRKPCVSIDTQAFIQEFKEAGFETQTYTFDEIANSDYTNEKDLEQYTEYVTEYKPFIIQEFIPDLEFDYRVLVLSLDICEKDGKFYLIEYQALHFGINVFAKSEGYYTPSGNGCIYKKRTSTFESELAVAYIKHITNIYL